MIRYLALSLVIACGRDAAPPRDRVVVVADAAIDAAPVADSPETLARTFLAALASGDPARVRALYMTPEHVTALVSCDKDPVLELREHIHEVEQQMGPSSSEVKFRSWQQDGRSVLKAGSVEDGCTAKRDFELALGSVKFTVTSRKGVTERDSKILAVVRVGTEWRVWKMSKL